MHCAMKFTLLSRWLIVAAFALALLSGLTDQRYGVADDLKHAAIAHEMMRTRDALTPGPPGLRDFHRPPLIHWATAGCVRSVENAPWAARLPSAFSAGGTLLLLAWIGRRLGGARVGLAAPGILFSCLGFFAFAHTLTPDMMLTFWITAAVACFVGHALGGGRWFEAAFFLAIGLGLLTDGLMAAIVPIGAALGWNFGRRRARQATVSLDWISGSIVALAIPLAWIFAQSWRDGSTLEHIRAGGIFSLFGGRSPLTTLTSLALPFVVAAGSLPWLPVAVGASLSALALRAGGWRLSPTGWLLLGWSVPPILVLLIVHPRSFGDALPIAPAFALWIAGRGNWTDADPSRPSAGLAGFWCAWGNRVGLLCALVFIVSPALAVAAASMTLPGFERFGFSPWFGPLLAFLAIAISFSIYGWTRRPEANAVGQWIAFEDAAGAGLAGLGVGLWLLLGWQVDALRGLLGPG
jgi:4-amino-4-deoxy-L-arabinose transferase-like glycosyltransferase